MNKNRIELHLNGRHISLIGTAHVSRQSIEEVSACIRDEKPGMVCVELDEKRYNAMVQKDSWERLDVTKVFKEGNGFLLAANLVLAGFQRRLGNELGVKPGEEMKTAVETAQELGIPYRLCDREVRITLRRAWAVCGLWSKCKLLAALLSSAFSTEKPGAEKIENLKERSELDGMMAELADYLPGVKETLIDERDQYLAEKIWEASAPPEGASAAPPPTAAIAGAGHLPGIQAALERRAAGGPPPRLDELNAIPAPRWYGKAAGWILPVLLAALIAAGFFRAGADVSLAMLLRWILWNGSLAAAGTCIAGGHPLSILVSFLGAPIATINPFIGVGLFAGVVEAACRKPRVSDAETLAEDAASIKGVYRNRITRALLVFFLSSIGGVIGNLISIPALARLLVQ
jgi:pheromone shutdown-related protein TraB